VVCINFTTMMRAHYVVVPALTFFLLLLSVVVVTTTGQLTGDEEAVKADLLAQLKSYYQILTMVDITM